MRPIWILNRTTLYIEQVAEATKMAEKWLPHLSFILLIVNSGRENNEHQLNFKCSMVKTLAFLSASFNVHVWKTNWFFFYNKFTPASNNKAKMLNDES